MTNKRSMILGILLSLVIVTLMTFSLTYARYSDEVEPDGVISGVYCFQRSRNQVGG